MTESSSAKNQFVLCLGDLAKPLEPGQSYTIGQDDACDVQLGHGTVSEVHCRLQVTADDIVVHDLNSLAGTKIDGTPITDHPWAPGQVLEVGDIRIDLERREVPPPVPAGAAATAAPAFQIAAHTRHEPEFGELMLTELKRAPWFGLSVLIHAILLLVVWFFNQQDIPKGDGGVTFALENVEAEEVVEEDDADVDMVEETTEIEDTEFTEVETEMVEEETFFEEVDTSEYEGAMTDMGDLLTKVKSGTGLDDILRVGNRAISGKFRKTIGSLRKNGLEIMFVFDSTGSMGAVLQAAKERMAKMANVLLELVPYARVGVITYRDTKSTEVYLTRQVGLSRDFYRAINFTQVIYAGGGGDTPEAVYEALSEARRQKWSRTARRLIILIGDAPPHKKTEGRISSMVKDFAHNGRSFVHAIVTRPSAEPEISQVTQRTFARIAKDGRGEALTFEDEGKILKAVMSLAFGRRDSRSLEEVYRLVNLRSEKFSKSASKIASGAEPRQLRSMFMRRVVPHDVVKAILKNPKPAVLKQLVDFASKSSFPNQGKHAAAYILQKLLHLDEPPVDPEKGKPISRRRAERLRRYIDRNFR